ncbi:uncharacterized protein CBL_08962 [Carabus blaptoides fortunei]
MEKIVKVYDRENYVKLLEGIKVIQLHKFDSTSSVGDTSTHIPTVDELNISDTLTCSFCKITFEDTISQRQHYKTDWHRYNLKQNLRSLEPISEDGFDNLAGDVSSISGSDSESDDISDPADRDNTALAVSQGKIFFQNAEGKVFSMYRSVLHEKKDAPSTDDGLVRLARQCLKNTFWTVLMLGGGHFAGAVYNGSEVLVHKTFHCYTVRAKQGGSQGARDNKSAGSHPKSAGASLRRYNEQSLVQHVGDILQTWTPHIDKSHVIFYRAAGPYNRSVLFGGKSPVLKKHDTRLRTIPFSTRRPTYTELQRVQDMLCSIEVYGSFDIIKTHFATQQQQQQQQQQNDDTSPTRSCRRDSPKNKNINRAKSRETKERPLPGATDNEDTPSTDEERCYELSSEHLELSLSELKEYGDTVPPEVVRRAKQQARNKKKKKVPKKRDRVKKWEETVKKDLHMVCTKGDLDKLKDIVTGVRDFRTTEQAETTVENENDGGEKLVNMVVDEHGNTLLHLAAIHNHEQLIVWLLDNNASPCTKNDKQHTPYTVNTDKSVRTVFRNYAATNPDRYNYAKSQIPTVTKTEEELAEKRKALRRIKKEKEKEKRKENEIKRKDQDEKDRYLKLSDREKRALAAERRLLANCPTVLVRCFVCAEDISGKVPFEYSGNRFCSIDCLKAHRMQHPVVIS